MSQPAPLSTAPPTSTSNGVLTAPTGRSAPGGNKKKAKRRAKAAAKAEAHQHGLPAPPHTNGQLPSQPVYPPVDQYYGADGAQYPDTSYDPNQQYDDQYGYSSGEEDEDDPIAYADHHHHVANGSAYPDHSPLSGAERRKKKSNALPPPQPSRRRTADLVEAAMNRYRDKMPPRQVSKTSKQDRIWNTSTQEERERIKEFWLSLSEEERKGLLKIEKNAVLSKMKEQQKHSCSCTVCGRKRTAIEEELEVLYDAYYEELAQYANQQPGEVGEKLLEQRRPSLNYPPQHLAHAPRPLNTSHAPHHRTSRVHEIIDDGEQEGYSDEEDSFSENDEGFSDEEYEEEFPPGAGAGFFDFGNNLTVKGGSFITDMLTRFGRLNNLPDGILTVADDLLKNDGKKFIEMMEQLAERRMQRERLVEYNSHRPVHNHPNDPPLDDDEEFDEEDDYDSAEEYDDDEEESEMVCSTAESEEASLTPPQGGLTDEQRMEEGRRMFQIFAARMFEQRVLTAYREKVAAERQAKLLEELEEEDKAKTQKDAKKAKEAEKKKNKKQAQKQAKAEEKAKKDAEKAAEEAAAKAAEEKRLEEQRKRKEEQRKKKEAEKKAAEEDRLRKEAERLKRQQEERDRKAEEERKAREQKALEKRVKEEQRKKEREEREAREKEIREQKAHDDKMRKEQESREKPSDRPLTAQQPPHIIKRPSATGQVAVPPALVQQKPASSPSPHVPIATPAMPKAGTPGVRTRQSSAQDSTATSPRSNAPGGPAAAKARSPTTGAEQQQVAPKQILQNPHKQHHQQQQRPAVSLPQPASHQGPPPGVHPPYQHGGIGNMGFPSFTGHPQAPMHQRPGGPQGGPPGAQVPPGPPFRQPPPGVSIPGQGAFGGPLGRGFSGDAPPGFPQQLPNLGSHAHPVSAPAAPGARAPGHSHSRQPSATEHDMSPPAHAQPIARPAPIQRPSSVKLASGGGTDVDDLSKHLGSRALLDDVDDPLPPAADLRMASNPIGAPRGSSMGFASPHFGAPPPPRMDTFANPQSSWSTPTTFGPPSGLPSGLTTPSWGGSLVGNNTWSSAAPFGPLGGVSRPANHSRPRAVRLAVCAACRSLGADYYDVSLVLSQMERQGPPLADGPPSLQEIEDICETEGDAHNGGGLLHSRRSGPNFAVKFDPSDNGGPAGGPAGGSAPNSARPGGASSGAAGGAGPHNQLGEIGSPVPGSAQPAFGGGGPGGRGFGSIGGLASPGGF